MGLAKGKDSLFWGAHKLYKEGQHYVSLRECFDFECLMVVGLPPPLPTFQNPVSAPEIAVKSKW